VRGKEAEKERKAVKEGMYEKVNLGSVKVHVFVCCFREEAVFVLNFYFRMDFLFFD
jgi:hypothetical protein